MVEAVSTGGLSLVTKPCPTAPVPVYLTLDEISSLLAQYKDRHLSSADAKLAEAYKAATGKEI